MRPVNLENPEILSNDLHRKKRFTRFQDLHDDQDDMPKRIILNTFGSFGDIHPYMAMALELQRRGHVPVIATMEGYREKIEGVGLEFAPVRPDIPQPKEQGSELVEKIMEP